MAHWVQKDFDGKTPQQRLELACHYDDRLQWFSTEDFELAKIEASKALAEGAKMPGDLLVQVALFSAPSMLYFLLDEAKVDIDTRDTVNATLLHAFVRDNRHSKVLYVIERGADVNAKKNGGDRPLHIAMEWQDIDAHIVKILLENGADPNVKNNDGNTPLQMLYHDDYFKDDTGIILSKIKLLIEHGADVNMPNNYDLTPLHLAAGGVESYITSAEKERLKRPELFELHQKMSGAWLGIAELLIANGANADAIDRQGLKPRDFLPETLHAKWDAMVEKAKPTSINPGSTQVRGADGPENRGPSKGNG